MYDFVIIGCGLAGMVAARKFADEGFKCLIVEKRKHIAGNIYDEVDHNGFLIQKYGPHCFFTNDETIKPFVENYIDVENCFVKCRTMIDNKKIPMPFNFDSIDIIYDKDKAEKLKYALKKKFGDQEVVAVTDLLSCDEKIIKEYGKYMYENEYKLYTAKQWGIDISEISPEVFKRVPVYLSYRDTYQSHKFQFLPIGGFTEFAKRLLDAPNIDMVLNTDAIETNVIQFEENKICVNWKGQKYENIPILFTGELDALFCYEFGKLPYRSLEFVWKLVDAEEFQETEIVAYPQADKITRVTEYKKLPKQNIFKKTEISIEFPVPYDKNLPIGNEPYYPIKNDTNDKKYSRYYEKASLIKNLYLCGRLADYKYYNMDMVIRRAWIVADKMMEDRLHVTKGI